MFTAPTTKQTIGAILDGRRANHCFDGTLSPLQIGLPVEVFDKDANSPKKVLDALVNETESSSHLRLRKELSLEDVLLADGTKAMLLSAEMDKLNRNRLSLYFKLVCSGKRDQTLVATGWIVCGKAAYNFVSRTRIVGFLKAHVTSLVVNDEQFDNTSLGKVYQ